MIAPGSVTARRDSTRDLYVAVISNAIPLAADTGRVIACPFIPGPIPDDTMAIVVAIEHPKGVVLPELVQWLPAVALDDPIGALSAAELRHATDIISALIS